jgi:hypothetical protein
LPEYNLPTGRADVFLQTYPNQKLTPMQLHDIFEIKRVPKHASDEEFETKFCEVKAQAIRCKSGEYANFRCVAVCFRGNWDFKMEVF